MNGHDEKDVHGRVSDLKILLIGKKGQVGWELRRALAPLGEVTALGRGEIDLTHHGGVRQTVRAFRPDLIVNAAAYTAVDRAEEEPDLARVVNGVAPGILAEEAKRIGALLVHYSTDYVFDGKKRTPYHEDDKPNPLNVYGATKLEGERRVQEVDGSFLIFRTSWVYALRGRNFVRTMLRLAEERPKIRIVDDQYGSPTWARLIAEATSSVVGQVLETRGAGCRALYHLTSSGSTTWYGFARTFLPEVFGRKIENRLVPIESVAYPTSAARPAYSVLNCSSLQKDFQLRLPEWDDDVRAAIHSEVECRT